MLFRAAVGEHAQGAGPRRVHVDDRADLPSAVGGDTRFAPLRDRRHLELALGLDQLHLGVAVAPPHSKDIVHDLTVTGRVRAARWAGIQGEPTGQALWSNGRNEREGIDQ